MNLIKKLNMFLFGSESISTSDALWYYGLNGMSLLMPMMLLVKKLIE